MAFMAHECPRMKKTKELKTPNGQTAWHYYQTYMRGYKRMPPSGEAFLDSKLFRTFMNFVIFSKKVQLPQPLTFIWFMRQKDYPPTMWTSDDVYSQYLSFVDTKIPPIKQAEYSVATIQDYADVHKIDCGDIFSHINPNELIHMVRTRKLSPWLLLSCKAFGRFFAALNDEQQSILETLINPDEWSDKLEQYSVEVKTIKLFVDALGL
jgi:hypothetical protein